MSDKPVKHYGPKNWPDSLRETVYKDVRDNNDTQVTQEIVNGWVDNFDRLSEQFRRDHETLIQKIK